MNTFSKKQLKFISYCMGRITHIALLPFIKQMQSRIAWISLEVKYQMNLNSLNTCQKKTFWNYEFDTKIAKAVW